MVLARLVAFLRARPESVTVPPSCEPSMGLPLMGMTGGADEVSPPTLTPVVSKTRPLEWAIWVSARPVSGRPVSGVAWIARPFRLYFYLSDDTPAPV